MKVLPASIPNRKSNQRARSRMVSTLRSKAVPAQAPEPGLRGDGPASRRPRSMQRVQQTWQCALAVLCCMRMWQALVIGASWQRVSCAGALASTRGTNQEGLASSPWLLGHLQPTSQQPRGSVPFQPDTGRSAAHSTLLLLPSRRLAVCRAGLDSESTETAKEVLPGEERELPCHRVLTGLPALEGSGRADRLGSGSMERLQESQGSGLSHLTFD
jgi:hypothetical protein